MHDQENIFARIVRKEVPASFVFEDDAVVVFKDHNAQAPLHLLIVPKRAYISFQDFMMGATVEEVHHFFSIIHQMANTHRVESAYRVVMNIGPKGGQEVAYFHAHLLGWYGPHETEDKKPG